VVFSYGRCANAVCIVIRGVVYAPRRREATKVRQGSPLSFVTDWLLFVFHRKDNNEALSQSQHLYSYRPHPPDSSTTCLSTMAVDEATQTNGVPEPSAGQLKKEEVEQSKWSVQSGMS
jgi:hypothetical protein